MKLNYKIVDKVLCTLFLSSLFFLTACQSVGDKNKTALDVPQAKYRLELKSKTVPLKGKKNIPIQKTQVNSRTQRMDLDFELQETQKKAPEKLFNVADLMEKSKGKKWMEEKIPVALSSDVLDIRTLIKIMSSKGMLDFKYVIDPRVEGMVESNLKEEQLMTRREVWDLFEYLLWLNSTYLSSAESGVLSVFPLENMPQDKNLLSQFHTENVAVEFRDLRYIQSEDAVPIIEPFLSDDAMIEAIPDSNTVLIVDSPINIRKVDELLKVVDRSSLKTWPKRAFACENINCTQLLEELEKLLPILGLPTSRQGNGNSKLNDGTVKLLALERTGMLIVTAATNEVLDEIENWIYLLDKAETGEREQIFTYPVKHGSPERLLEAIDTFFSNSSSRQSSRPQSGTSTSERAASTTGETSRSSNTTANRKNSDTEDKSIFGTPVTIYQDFNLNKLIIKTTPRAFAMIEALMSLLDQPASQVLIQVTAVNINLGNDLEYGFSYAANEKFGDRNASTSAGNNVTGALQPDVLNPLGAAPNGLSFLLSKAGTDDEFAFIRAVAGDSNTELLFTPQLVTGNGKEAVLKIVQEVPYSRGTTQNNNDTTVQNIEYRETGVTLTVTPYITSDGRVTMTIKQEISSISDTTVDGIDSPVFNSDSVETELTLNNKDTFLLGGMITTEERSVESGVPYLKDIPYLGFFFRGTDERKARRELILLVKPQIINNASQHQQMLDRYQNAVKKLLKDKKDWK